jgi:hypothetical protein
MKQHYYAKQCYASFNHDVIMMRVLMLREKTEYYAK